MRRLKLWFLKAWWWITKRQWILADGSYIPTRGIVQPLQGKRKKIGTRTRIRKTIVESRPPKPPKKRQRDIEQESLRKLLAAREVT